ncbi:hypothetical protein CAEBREN_24799 [Caenorhabditis brenneri]|uniref:Sulfotransferase domain-containing protein n=1 Tax=Caenorhabditis brenneri TaxID=135651 RepID=G0NIR7_CAEBE|nr:hypothetical protein CAEBREN_24799 [Caenorhabditis brenneri]
MCDFIPPFLPLVNDALVTEKHNLLGCSIRKSMSQLSINIICYLNDPEEFERNNQSFSDTWKEDRKSCQAFSETSLDPTKIDPKILNSKNLTRFAFVRDPMERFVSFFMDKCIKENYCWDCVDDVRCVVQHIYERLQKNILDPKHVKADNDTWMDWHVAPQSWNCDFKNFIKDFHLIHIGPSNEERSEAFEKLEKVLNSAKIPSEQIQKIAEAVRNGTTNHATYMSKDREKVLKRIEDDKYVKDYLRKIYYHDYKVFGFTIKDNK